MALTRTDIGNRIKEARKRLDLKKNEVAAALGVSGTQVGRWETGENVPTIDKLAGLCTALKKPPEYFITDDLPEQDPLSLGQATALVEQLGRELEEAQKTLKKLPPEIKRSLDDKVLMNLLVQQVLSTERAEEAPSKNQDAGSKSRS